MNDDRDMTIEEYMTWLESHIETLRKQGKTGEQIDDAVETLLS